MIATPSVLQAETSVPSTASAAAASPGSGSWTGIDLCSLLTKDEVKAAIGGDEIGELDRSKQAPSGDWCSYPAVGASDKVVMGLIPGVDATEFMDRVEADAVVGVTPIPNLGDEAYSDLAVSVRKGDLMMVVSIDASKK